MSSLIEKQHTLLEEKLASPSIKRETKYRRVQDISVITQIMIPRRARGFELSG